MAKQQLAIFDLDSTLIMGDSFRSLILKKMMLRPQLILFLSLRLLRLIDRKSFAQKSHNALAPLLAKQSFLDSFLVSLESRVNQEVLADAQDRKKNGQKVILISASPHEYVSLFARKLGFDEGHGSNWRNDNYQHLYARGKLDFANENFSQKSYKWSYAISDSLSDADLLNSCENHKYWK